MNPVFPECPGGGGNSKSSNRSTACSRAFSLTSTCISSLTIVLLSSTRSRTIDSTSRPTYPTSVYLEASTLMKGDFASLASRRAISVFPTPVGPIMRMFFGPTSSRNDSGSCCLRQRFLKAIATARLALFCPTINLSNSATICFGVKESVNSPCGSLEFF